MTLTPAQQAALDHARRALAEEDGNRFNSDAYWRGYLRATLQDLVGTFTGGGES